MTCSIRNFSTDVQFLEWVSRNNRQNSDSGTFRFSSHSWSKSYNNVFWNIFSIIFCFKFHHHSFPLTPSKILKKKCNTLQRTINRNYIIIGQKSSLFILSEALGIWAQILRSPKGIKLGLQVDDFWEIFFKTYPLILFLLFACFAFKRHACLCEALDFYNYKLKRKN